MGCTTEVKNIISPFKGMLASGIGVAYDCASK